MRATVGTDLEHAAELLCSGELVAMPTETVYGLAAHAFDPEAVLKIFTVKDRPAFDPLIVHVGRREDLSAVASELPPGSEQLMDLFWPGPLTLVLPKHENIPDIVTSGLDTVAVRMPAHPIALQLLQKLPFPLAAPSANPFGYVSPTSAQHVADQLGAKIPYILDGGPCNVGVESTIIGWEPRGQGGQWVIYRHGGLPIEELENVIGVTGSETVHQHPLAPGMIASHYAPRKPVFIGDVQALMRRNAGKIIGVISFQNEYVAHSCDVLSAGGDLAQAARNLFAALRELDGSECDVIIAEEFPDHGLGRAINDRLNRAAAARH